MKTGCVIMASGLSTRFGQNKLLAELNGKSFLQHALDLTAGDLFARRIAVTRSAEAAEICRSQGVDVILHELPGRNDAVRLGIEAMQEMDGCLFCPCDQPLLRRESLVQMTERFYRTAEENNPERTAADCIFRLACKDTPGTPVLFGKTYFAELGSLPAKRGGAYLAQKYPGRVILIQAEDELELFDIDTQEQLVFLNERIKTTAELS